jgi:hypothetical protein
MDYAIIRAAHAVCGLRTTFSVQPAFPTVLPCLLLLAGTSWLCGANSVCLFGGTWSNRSTMAWGIQRRGS